MDDWFVQNIVKNTTLKSNLTKEEAYKLAEKANKRANRSCNTDGFLIYIPDYQMSQPQC